MSKDLFSDNPDDQSTTVNILDQLVGEGKKFATVEDLAKGKAEADKFIEQLTLETKGLRETMKDLEAKASKAATLEEVLNKLKPSTDTSSEDGSNQPTLNPEELKKMVQSLVSETEQERIRRTNKEEANNKLVERFHGDENKAREFLTTKAKELGMSKEELSKLAESAPKAFSNLLGIDPSPRQFQTPSGLPRANTQAFTNVDPSRQTVEYYRELKAKDSKLFWSKEVQQQLYKVAASNGGPEFVQKVINSQ